MKKLLIVLLLSFCALNSCKKAAKEMVNNVDATIIFTGSVAADGCGFIVKINATGANYHADNLAVSYQKDNLPVTISYHLLSTKFSCGLLSNNISVIKLDAIQNK